MQKGTVAWTDPVKKWVSNKASNDNDCERNAWKARREQLADKTKRYDENDNEYEKSEGEHRGVLGLT